VFRQLLLTRGLADIVLVDSAGTHAYHVGEPPDRRAQAAALRRGVDISGLRARRVAAGDFDRFDYILAMDQDNLVDLQAACPPAANHKLKLFLEYGSGLTERNVPDPYYGGAAGFERVLDMVEVAAEGLLMQLQRELGRV
jgi:protein-tyrosine phosphatase